MSRSLSRRRLLGNAFAGTLAWMAPKPAAGTAFPVQLRKRHPYESLFASIQPGRDEFAGEKTAAEITAILEELPRTRTLPLTPDFRGISPFPASYRQAASDVSCAEFDRTDTRFAEGLQKWI